MEETSTIQTSEQSSDKGGLSRKLLHSQHGITIHRISGSTSDLLSREVAIDPSESMLLVSLSGSAVYVSERMKIRRVQPPQGAFLVRGPIKLDVHFARGMHRWLEITWQDSALKALADWQESESKGGPSTWSCHFDDHAPFLTDSLGTLWDALSHGQRNQEPLIVSIIAILADMAVNGEIKDTLASIPSSVPEPLVSLMRAVKARPTDTWSLKEAASMAGYSAFHLSRTFRVAVDYGFPEFVDRCRTELAVQELLTTENSIEEIATHSGFGSTQSLRSACREYLGFLPSEIRSVQIGLH